MKSFGPDYVLLDEMYQDDYYPTFLVDKEEQKEKFVASLPMLVEYFV